MSAVPPPAPAPAAVSDGGGGSGSGHLKPRSRWWLVYSVFLVSGILAYFALRYDDIKRAEQCLIIGAIMLGLTVGPFLLMLALYGVAGVAGLLE